MFAALALTLALAPPASPASPAPTETASVPRTVTRSTAGVLRGTVVDEVDFLPRQGVTLLLSCECEMEDQARSSGDDGTFAFEGLTPGRYRLTLFGGDGEVEHEYEVAAGQERALVLAVAPARLPERDARKLPVYSGYSRKARLRAAQVELSVGGVLLAGGFVMIVGAAVEGTKPECPHGVDTCGAPPRRGLATGLGVAGGIAAAAGAVLVGLGVTHRRQYRLGVGASRSGGTLTFGARF